ncbi:MAG: hypothetical protein AAF497_11100, partial [Planctomycetota bacterium]
SIYRGSKSEMCSLGMSCCAERRASHSHITGKTRGWGILLHPAAVLRYGKFVAGSASLRSLMPAYSMQVAKDPCELVSHGEYDFLLTGFKKDCGGRAGDVDFNSRFTETATYAGSFSASVAGTRT